MPVKYYRWLTNIACDNYHRKYYDKLLNDLYETEFYWIMPLDEDRSIDGIGLREQYLDERGGSTIPCIDGGCSILEMMVALAIRCEQEVHGNSNGYDGISDWFWGMIVSLGLDRNDDGNYDPELTQAVLETFLERRYRKDGKGGLFFIDGFDGNMTRMLIWRQAMCYIG